MISKSIWYEYLISWNLFRKNKLTPQIKHFDSLGREFQTDDDNYVYVKDEDDNDVKLVEKIVYGTDATKNNIGQVHKQYDQSGVIEIVEYDFKGNPLQTIKRFTESYDVAIDWTNDVTFLN